MGFAVSGLALLLSGSRPLASWSFNRLFALTELRSVVLAVMVFFILLVLAYLTNPSETSFRAFLTEQSFRHHLSKLDDADIQDELDPPGSSAAFRSDTFSRRGLGTYPKHRSINASPPFAFSSRASVSLRTPKHIFRSFGILSIAAVVPSNPSNRSTTSRSQRADSNSTRENGSNDGVNNAHASLVLDSIFIGAFGMWFWAANADGFWKDAGIVTKDEVDGTVSGVLGIKALDRSDEPDQILLPTSNSHHSPQNHVHRSQRSSPKGRSRERFVHHNGHANGHRSSTPPPLPKSASLPLHTKRVALPATPEKSHHSGSLVNGSPFSNPSTTSSLTQASLANSTSDSRTASATPLCTSASTCSLASMSPTASPTRSPSLLFASSPMIAEILRQISASQTTLTDIRTQLTDFHQSSASTRSALQSELEMQRERKRSDDAAKAALKTQMKALEDQKRTAEGARRDVEKRLKAARAQRDGAVTRTERLEQAIQELHQQMEAQGAAIVASGVESGALASELAVQVEEKKKEIKEVEEEVVLLGGRVRELEEKIVAEEKRLENACADAELRKQSQNQSQEKKGLTPNGGAVSAGVGAWHAHPHVQTSYAVPAESKPLERSDVFPPSPVAVTASISPLSISTSGLKSRRTSVSTVPLQPLSSTSTAKGYSIFDADLASFHPLRTAHQAAHNVSSSFSPFTDSPISHVSPGNSGAGPLSPTTESLIPSSLYESLGMSGSLGSAAARRAGSIGMDISRSFQSEDDVILDRDWLTHRNASVGDVGQPVYAAAPGSASTCTAAEVSPVSPAASEYDPFETHPSLRERFSSTHLDLQRAAAGSFTSDSAGSQGSTEDMPFVPPVVTSRRSGWFTSSKDKDLKKDSKEKKGLNPDAKEFSLSKDKERSFSAFLTRSRGVFTPTSNPGSASSSTPSSASLSTPESLSALQASELGTGNGASSLASATFPSNRSAASLFGLGSAWFGSPRASAFAPTPTERAQLGRVLGSNNTSFDGLPSLSEVNSLPASPQPTPAIARAHSIHHARPAAAWMSSEAAPFVKSSFSPFADDEPKPNTTLTEQTTSAGKEHVGEP